MLSYETHETTLHETHETTLHETHETALPRPLGALEKLFWFINQNRPTHFAIAAEVGGSTRVKQWQDALDRVCRQSALIWSRLGRNGASFSIADFDGTTGAGIFCTGLQLQR